MTTLRAALFALLLLTTSRALDPTAYDAAVELYRQKDWPAAQTAFVALALAEPDHAGVQTYLGRLALQRDQPAPAVLHLEKAASLSPTDSRIQQWLGDAYGLSALKAGLFSKLSWAEKCRTAYEKSVELDPQNLSARVALLNFYLKAPAMAGGGTDKALRQAEAVQALDAPRGRLLVGQVHLAARQYDRAFASYQAAVLANPDDYAALVQLGRTARLWGQHVDEGLAALRHCLTLTPPANQPGADAVQALIADLTRLASEATATAPGTVQ